MIICDTDILIEFYRNNPSIVRELQEIGLDALAISAITQAELYFGARNKPELRKIQIHLSSLHILHVTQPISTLFIALMEQYVLSYTLSIPDALIAATALHHDAPLFTRNIKDFRYIPELDLHGL